MKRGGEIPPRLFLMLPVYAAKQKEDSRMSIQNRVSSRRKFLLMGMGLGAAAVAFKNLLGQQTRLSGNRSERGELRTFNRTSWALGSDVTLTVLHDDEARARQALDAAFVELDGVEDALSLYRPLSQLCRLNREGVLDKPHAHMLRVLEACQAMSKRSSGAFDASVQPLWELYFDSKKNGGLPADDAIASARAKVDWTKIGVSAEQISLGASGMKLTFNGIAQGYAADRVMSVLKAHGIEHALIDTGELEPLGRKADGTAFRCGIQHPRQADAFAGVCKLDGRALATSGDYATKFSDDFVYHHIFNPATGRSPLEFSSVSILAPTAMLADALTKPVFVLGREKGLELVRSLPGCDAFIIFKDGRTLVTPGFPIEA